MAAILDSVFPYQESKLKPVSFVYFFIFSHLQLFKVLKDGCTKTSDREK